MLAPNHYFPPFSQSEFERRRRVLREGMKELELDCLIIYGATHLGGNDTGQVNAQYLSNFAAVGHTYVLLPQKENPTYHIGMDLHVPNAKDVGAIEDVRGGIYLEIGVAARLKELALEKGRIGLVGSAVSFFMPCTLPHEHYVYLTKELPEAEFVEVYEWYENIRSIKSEEELKLIEEAAALNDLCHEELFHATRPGMTHSDLRRIVEEVSFMHRGNYCMMHMGSWPMSNQNWPYPDFWPTTRTVEEDHLVMTEMPVGYGMYYTKLMNTYFTGEPTKEYRDMFELAASVQKSVIEGLKPGMKGSDVNQFAAPLRDGGFIAGGMVSGWCNYNGPPFVGQTHEGIPSAPKQSHMDLVFKPGLCVQVMAYPIAADFSKGLWVGSTCVFTENGLRELNKYPVREIRVR